MTTAQAGAVTADTRLRADISLVLYPVDLVDLSCAEPALRERVERDGIPWRS